MKDLTKIYIDLSKCTEEQRKHIFSLLPEPVKKGDYFIDNEIHILHFNTLFAYPRWYVDFEYYNKQELTYPEFIKLFEGGEGEKVLQVGKILNYLSDRNDELAKKPCFENVCRMAEISRVIQMIKSNNQ